MNPITDSRVVTGEEYVPETKTLVLRYKNGFHYHHANVEPEQYADFQQAPSKGAWIAANLSGKKAANHPFTKVMPPPEG